MNLQCKLVKKTFTADNGEVRHYHVLVFDLTDNETLEITIKSDKAKLLMLNERLHNNDMPDLSFWSSNDTKSLNN